jgi:hypothetical protein
VAELPRIPAARYVQPLREGGSLPAVVDSPDGLFVVKFRGAGQGVKVLVAELIAAMLARAVGLPVPDAALVELSSAFGRSESDPEIQHILRNSHGVNIGLRYLDGAFNFDAHAAGDLVSHELATRIVWFDAIITNPDRTHQNPNLLIWNRTPWLIDHGAALYAHHDWANVNADRARSPFTRIRDHVLLTRSEDLQTIDEEMRALLPDALIERVVVALPGELLEGDEYGAELPSVEAVRERYIWYLTTRLSASREIAAGAAEARAARMREKPVARSTRR